MSEIAPSIIQIKPYLQNSIVLSEALSIKRVVPPTSPEYEGKNMVYVFDSEDSFNLTYDELVEIISMARMTGPQMIPILGTVGD
ncbi:hypothetical protein MW368_003469 [Acinetobacter baumannii]|nr:hypothetical protein [Acinetobacter baumannii]